VTAVLPRVLLVASGRRCRDLEAAVSAAIAGGIRFVQVRVSDEDDDALLESLSRLRDASPTGVVWSVNARVEVARTASVGLHLPAAAPGPVGLRPVPLGRSAHDPSEMAVAVRERVDYVVVGTVHPTASKPGRDTLGPGGLRDLVARAAGRPVFAIGGQRPDRVADALAAGCHGVAVVSWVLGSDRPQEAARRLVEAVAAHAGVH
jgi:thiamine-phosphate diphosphorylase